MKLLWILCMTAAAVVVAVIEDIRNEFPPQERVSEFAILSANVYLISDVPENVIDTNQYDVLKWLDVGSTEVLITKSVDTEDIIVTFRGSEEIADWLVNADFFQVPLFPINGTIHTSTNIQSMLLPPEGSGTVSEEVPIMVHRGFHQVFRLYDEILTALNDTNPALRKVYVTGHSLGGANAHLFATVLALTHPASLQVRCVTFGQPRVGNLGMKMLVEQIRNLNLWRFVNQDDVVPRIPLPSQNFTHAGHYYYFNSTNVTTAYYRQIGDTSQQLDGIPDVSYAMFNEGKADPVDFVKDHSMVYYIHWVSDLNRPLPTEFAKITTTS